MPIVVECRCRQRYSAPESMVGSVAPCPACGATIQVVGPPQPLSPSTMSTPTAAASPPSAWQQFRRNPVWFMLRGVEVAEYQRTLSAPAKRSYSWAILGLLLVVLAFEAATFLVATARFGVVTASLMALMAFGVSFVPLAFGFYFLASGLLEWGILFQSRRGRGARYLFGDQGARFFFIGVGGVALCIGLVIQLAFLAGAVIGRDPHRDRNAPAPVDMSKHVREIPAPPPAERERIKEEAIREFEKAFEGTDVEGVQEAIEEFRKRQ